MDYQSEAQLIEAFHLVFLRVLGAKRPDWYTLKGGANLRYFFGSERYSNDIDFDFHGREGWMATESISDILGGPALALRSETKAREIFDLSLLFRVLKASKRDTTELSSAYVQEAQAKSQQIGYKNFQSEVLPFLDPEIGELYDSADAWALMRDTVIESLRSLSLSE